MKKTTNRIGTWILTISLIIGIVGTIPFAASATNAVNLNVAAKKDVEVALAVGDTKVDYADFENELKAALASRGIENSRVSFNKFDANSSTTQNSFNWWTYDHTYSGSSINDSTNQYIENVNIGTYTQSANDYNNLSTHISTTNSGRTMTFYGYGSCAYKDWNFLPNSQSTKKTISFTITEGEAHDALDGVGFLFNTSITGQYANQTQRLNGYLLFFQYTGSIGSKIRLYELKNVDTKVFHHNTTAACAKACFYNGDVEGVTLLAENTSYGDYKYRKVSVEVMPTYIKLWYAGSSNESTLTSELKSSNLITWTRKTDSSTFTEYPITAGYDTLSGKQVFRGGYGPLASYKPHNCAQLTNLTLSDLSMQAEYVRSLTEVVREPSWNEDKLSFLVNLNESSIDDFSNAYSSGEIINRLADDKISYIGWGSNTNKTASNIFLNGVGNGSGFVNVNDDTSPYEATSRANQIGKIADIIAARVAAETSALTETYLDTDEIGFIVEGTTLNDGLWSVGYNANRFSAASNNVSTYQDLRYATFKEVGYYEIYHDGNTSTPKAQIRVHKVPIANFETAVTTEGKINLTNKSYDPEFCSVIADAAGETDDGIDVAKTKIEYRNVTNGTAWTTVDSTHPLLGVTISANEVWMVRLTVTDNDGATATMVQQVTRPAASEGASNPVAPYGTFRLSDIQYITGVNDTAISIVDNSYALDDSTVTVNYTIKNSNGSVIASPTVSLRGTTVIPTTALATAGSYTVEMTATATKNGKTAVSAPIKKTYTVVQGYTVTYFPEATDVTNMPEIQYKVQGQTLSLASAAPSRTGYTFTGWQIGNTTDSYQPGAAYATNENLELKAIWKKNMTYTANGYAGVYDGLDHQISILTTDPTTDVTIKYGTAENAVTSTENIKWKNAGTTTVYFSLEKDSYLTVNNNRSIVISKAEPTITLEDQAVSYDGTAREIDPAVVTGINSTDKPTGTITYLYYVDSNCTTLTTNVNSGAANDGAAPVNAGVYYVTATVPEETNYTEKTSAPVMFRVRKYDVNFEMKDHGSSIPKLADVIGGSNIQAPTTPTDDDYRFMGWYKDTDLGTVWNFQTDTVDDDMTLFASWKSKDTFETSWTVPGTGKIDYGTFEECMASVAADPTSKYAIVIQNDTKIDSDITIPENAQLVVTESTTLTIADNVTLTNLGSLVNDGSIKIPTTGKIDNQGSIQNNNLLKNDGELGTSGSIDNIKDATIIGNGSIKGTDDNKITNEGVLVVTGKVEASITGNGKTDSVLPARYDDTTKQQKIDSAVLVGVGEGTLSVVVTSVDKDDTPTGKVITGVVVSDLEDVVNTCLDKQEREQLENGENIQVRVTVKLCEDKVSEDSKKSIEKVIKETKTEDNKSDVNLATYIDINFEKKIGANSWEKISNLSDEIEIVIDIPEEYLADGRDFYVVRNHDGICTVLKDLDNNPKTITIRTDRFSTYAIAYTNQLEPEEGIANTADNTVIGAFIMMATVGMAGAYISTGKRKRKE